MAEKVDQMDPDEKIVEIEIERLRVFENHPFRVEMDAYSELIRENIELDILKERHPYDQELLEGIFDLILETVFCKNESIVIASNKYPAELVRSKFLKLNSSHLEYAIDCFKGNTTKVRNINICIRKCNRFSEEKVLPLSH